MSKVTTDDIQKIIDGGAVQIVEPYPLSDQGEGFEWFMAQPTDWVYDLAQAVREAAVAEAHSIPEIKAVASLPPTAEWIETQNYSRQRTKDRIAELDAKGDAILPEEDLERANLRDHLSRLIDPSNYTRADEIVAKRAKKALESWLMPRLIQDAKGKLICDPTTEEGNRRWSQLGRDTKDALRVPFYQVYMLIQTAKNYKSGQSSN